MPECCNAHRGKVERWTNAAWVVEEPADFPPWKVGGVLQKPSGDLSQHDRQLIISKHDQRLISMSVRVEANQPWPKFWAKSVSCPEGWNGRFP